MEAVAEAGTQVVVEGERVAEGEEVAGAGTAVMRDLVTMVHAYEAVEGLLHQVVVVVLLEMVLVGEVRAAVTVVVEMLRLWAER